MENKEFLFESAWEVCNKIGGIHTVLTTKHLEIQKRFKDNYILLGPFEPNSIKEFIPEANINSIPLYLRKIFSELDNIGIHCHYGRWNTEGKPLVILLDFNNYCKNNNEIKAKLWDLYKIDSLGTDFNDFDRAILWSWCCGIVIEKISKKLIEMKKFEKIIAHFHEWMAGGGVLYLKQCKDSDIVKKVKTVFTTHATVLGRVLAGKGIDPTTFINDDYDNIARSYGVIAKHQAEKQSAIQASAFTTVSDITGEEALKFFNVKPAITYNGIDMARVPSEEEIKEMRAKTQLKLNNFLKKFLQKDVDIKNTTIMSIFGRYEFNVKGINIFSNAVGKLNKKLIKECSGRNSQDINNKTIVAFFFIPADARGARDDIDNPNRTYPLQCTHYLGDEQWNSIMKSFADNNLLNFPDDKINVIFCPIYLNGEDKILNITYKEAITASDLGVFPSFYEPWGYTPVESIAYSTPAITSDLAGFGRYILEKCPNEEKNLQILRRAGKSDEEATLQLIDILKNFLEKSEDEIKLMKKSAKNITKKVTWQKFIKKYFSVYDRL